MEMDFESLRNSTIAPSSTTVWTPRGTGWQGRVAAPQIIQLFQEPGWPGEYIQTTVDTIFSDRSK
jgi:hypothetical protein